MSPVDIDSITLTEGQQAALEQIHSFLLDPNDAVFVLRGYSGCGKSTLIRTFIDGLTAFNKVMHLICPTAPDYEVVMTATTNKAAENLQHITGLPTCTIHSHLGLRVQFDPKTRTSSIHPSRNTCTRESELIVIDEASYIDKKLLGLIFNYINPRTCKILFVGDPAQLTPVKSTGTPVFDTPFTGSALTEVVRQAKGNPIVELSSQFRETVNTGEFFSFRPDGEHVQYLERDAFNAKILGEFTRPDWKFLDSKVLGWTNKLVIEMNKFIREHAKGNPELQIGDYATCNSFIQVGKSSVKTDEMVEITDISSPTSRHGVPGKYFTLDRHITTFAPESLASRKARLKEASDNEEFSVAYEIQQSWADLRPAYACTINKAQGSTYDAVFIDLDDVSRCNSGDQIARMLYVAVSRARNHVYLTGDFV